MNKNGVIQVQYCMEKCATYLTLVPSFCVDAQSAFVRQFRRAEESAQTVD